MPPPDEKNQPSVAERNAVIKLIDEQILVAGSSETPKKAPRSGIRQLGEPRKALLR